MRGTLHPSYRVHAFSKGDDTRSGTGTFRDVHVSRRSFHVVISPERREDGTGGGAEWGGNGAAMDCLDVRLR